MAFANQFENLPALPKMISKGSRSAHVMGIAYIVAKSRNLIGSNVSFEEYNERRIKAEAEEKTL